MKKTNLFLSFLLIGTVLVSCKNGTDNKTQKENSKDSTQVEQRIVSLDGAITAIVAELGKGDLLVGRDATSTYPDWVRDSVKSLGRTQSLSMEALMALQPTLILVDKGDINPKLEKKLKASGVTCKFFSKEYTIPSVKSFIEDVALAIGVNDATNLTSEIDKSLSKIKSFKEEPEVLFIYARGAGTMMIAGEGTPIEALIDLAGGDNAVDDIKKYKPLTTEALINNNPDVIMMFNSGLKSLDGIDGLLKIPGISQTNAGKNKAVITMDGGLINNFGPRVGKAIYQLNQLLIPYAK